MRRFGLSLLLVSCLLCGAQGTGTGALAANSDLSRCIDPATVLSAGGDVSYQELKAAQSACARLKQSSPDRKTLLRIDHAAETIDEEVQRRAGR
jgi:hypothetical protein